MCSRTAHARARCGGEGERAARRDTPVSVALSVPPPFARADPRVHARVRAARRAAAGARGARRAGGARAVRAPVSSGQRMSNCGHTPIRRWIASIPSRIECPSTRAEPELGRKSPVSTEMVVDLPAPFGPSRPKHSFVSI